MLMRFILLPGQIQSPLGSLARTSTLPYLKAKLLVILADCSGCTMSLPADLTNEIPYIRSEDFTAVTMKNVVFWDIKILFVLHRRRIMSPLEGPTG
jgi:hypothetical protein